MATVYMIDAVREELERELAHIQRVEKPRLSRLIAGSSSEIEAEDRVEEGAEEQLEALDRREAELRDILSSAEIVAKPTSREAVAIGSVVTVEDNEGRHRYTVVGSVGADPEHGWITTESPLGAVLMGKRPGDLLTFAAPAGPRVATVVSID